MALLSTAPKYVQPFSTGQPAEVAKQNGCWSVISPIGKPFDSDHQSAPFRLLVPADIRYLT